METRLYAGTISNLETDLLVFLLEEEQMEWSGALAEVDGQLDGLLHQIADEEEFKGKSDSSVILHTHGRILPKRVAILGIGKEEVHSASIRNHAARVAQLADELRLSNVTMLLSSEADIDLARELRFAFEGASMGLYRFLRYRSREAKAASVVSFQVAFETEDGLVSLDEEVAGRSGEVARRIAEAVALTRDLVNEGPREMTPQRLAEVAETIAKEENLECTIFGLEEIREMKMELLLAVNAGSDLDPRLIHLTYRPEGAGDDTPVIAFVGKGLTFDAGGYNLKPTGAIDDMKIDMAGGGRLCLAR